MDTPEKTNDIPEKSLIGSPIKVQVRSEIKKLKQMTFKKKLEHIWEYYKFLIFGICFVALVMGLLIHSWMNPPPDTALFVAWSSGYATDSQLNELMDALGEQLIEESANEEVVVSHFFLSDEDPSVSMAGTQRMIAMFAAGVLDVLIVDLEQLEDKAYVGFLMPMERILSEIKIRNPPVYSLIEENIVYGTYDEEDGTYSEKIMGINIKGSPLLTRLEFFEQEQYFSVAATTKQPENIIKALIAFFE